MIKKNFSIILSVFIATFVISIMGYIFLNQQIEMYRYAKMSMVGDISINKTLDMESINELAKIDNVDSLGLKEKFKSAMIKGNTFSYTGYDKNLFEMQYGFLKEGNYPATSDELILPENAASQLNIKTGETIDITFGDRFLKGELVNPEKGKNDNEEFKPLTTKKYKVVGFYRSNNPFETKQVIGGLTESDEYYPVVKLKKLNIAHETREKIIEILGDKVEKSNVVLNNNLLKYSHVVNTGFSTIKFILNKLFIPLLFLITFVLIVKNIFNIWAIDKIKELSMYKSIGATNFQIYKILIKDSIKISLIPLIAGEIAGLITVKLVFTKIFSLQEILHNVKFGEFSFNWILVTGITAFLLLNIIITVSFPARMISKIGILDGLRGNLTIKNYKKKRYNKTFRELKVNNRKILMPTFIILVAGLASVMLMFALQGIDIYNREAWKYNRWYNSSVAYNAKEEGNLVVFDTLKKELNPEKSLVLRQKMFFVDTDKLKYSEEFNKIGFDERFRDTTYLPDNNMLYGVIIGIENNIFKKYSENPKDIIFVNQVQDNPKSFYREISYIPFMEPSIKNIDIKYLEELGLQQININKTIDYWPDEIDIQSLYTVVLFTSIDNFNRLMQDIKLTYEKNDTIFKEPAYTLNMKFDEEELNSYTGTIKRIMEDWVQANERYIVSNSVGEEENIQISAFGVELILGLVVVAAVFLNIANAYSTTNLSFINRKNEIGILISNGMDLGDLEKVLSREMLSRIIISLIIALSISIGVVVYLLSNISYIDPNRYIGFVRFEFLIPAVLIICLSSYFIYISAMKKVTRRNVIELLRGI